MKKDIIVLSHDIVARGDWQWDSEGRIWCRGMVIAKCEVDGQAIPHLARYIVEISNQFDVLFDQIIDLLNDLNGISLDKETVGLVEATRSTVKSISGGIWYETGSPGRFKRQPDSN